ATLDQFQYGYNNLYITDALVGISGLCLSLACRVWCGAQLGAAGTAGCACLSVPGCLFTFLSVSVRVGSLFVLGSCSCCLGGSLLFPCFRFPWRTAPVPVFLLPWRAAPAPELPVFLEGLSCSCSVSPGGPLLLPCSLGGLPLPSVSRGLADGPGTGGRCLPIPMRSRRTVFVNVCSPSL
ncbi:hypothetical protein D4764_0165590, partial [Takifugu flavidus]